MKILAVGDPHFKKDNQEETDRLYEELIEIIDSRNPDIIVVLGDIMHYHNIAYVDVILRAKTFLISLSKHRKVYALMGNHDYKSNRVQNYKEHFFSDINSDNLKIIDSPLLEQDIFFCPYVKEGYLWDLVEEKDIMKSKICFFHQEFKGAEVFPGHPSEDGDDWDESYPLAVSGHIHTWHMINNNICYVGTPFQHNFCKSPERKTVSIFENTEDNPEKWDQIRLDINIPKKLSIQTNVSGFKSFEYDGSSYLKFKIKDNARNMTNLKISPKFKEYSQNPKIKFLLTSVDEESIINLASKNDKISNYWQRLESKISKLPDDIKSDWKNIYQTLV